MDRIYSIKINQDTPLVSEGWTHIGTRLHYVRQGHSLCGRWWTPVEFPNDEDCPPIDRCSHCMKSLAKLKRGGTRLNKQDRTKKRD